jgi:hypothetical protein
MINLAASMLYQYRQAGAISIRVTCGGIPQISSARFHT